MEESLQVQQKKFVKIIDNRVLFNAIVRNLESSHSQRSKDLHIESFSSLITWVYENKDRYVFLGGKKVLIIDNTNNEITEIKGIGDWTYSAVLVGDELIIGGFDDIYFLNTTTLKVNHQIKHN